MNQIPRLTGMEMMLAMASLSVVIAADKPATRPAATEPASTQPSAVLESVKEGTTQPSDPPAEMSEGTMSDLLGQLTYNAKHEAMLRFSDHEGAAIKTLPILPNKNLARMESALESDGKDVWFKVSVVATVYQNHNYLLIRDASLLTEKP